MGLNLCSHELDQSTGIYEFAPINQFKPNSFFDDNIPHFKLTTNLNRLFKRIIGQEYIDSIDNCGDYTLKEDQIKKILNQLASYKHLNFDEYLVVSNMLQVSLKNGYQVSIL